MGENSESLAFGLMPVRKGPRRKAKVKAVPVTLPAGSPSSQAAIHIRRLGRDQAGQLANALVRELGIVAGADEGNGQGHGRDGHRPQKG